MKMTKILQHIFGRLSVTLGVVTAVFFFTRLTPGDPVEVIIGQGGPVASNELAQLREEFHLNEPIGIQFWYYLQSVVKGDLGFSYIFKKPVSSLIGDRLPATIELAACALMISLIIAIPAGIVSAVRQNSFFDRIIMYGVFLGASIPSFVLGFILIFVFAVWLKWLPVHGRIDLNIQLEGQTAFLVIPSIYHNNLQGFLSSLEHLILPSITLGVPVAVVTISVLRSSMIGALRSDYVKFARSKGIPEWRIIFRHAFRNSLIPVISVLGLQTGTLLSGSVIVESVFGWPGLGQLATKAILSRDYPLVQGCVLVYALVFIMSNLIVDSLYLYIDPRSQQY